MVSIKYSVLSIHPPYTPHTGGGGGHPGLSGDYRRHNRTAGLRPVAMVKPDEDHGHVIAGVFPIPENNETVKKGIKNYSDNNHGS